MHLDPENAVEGLVKRKSVKVWCQRVSRKWRSTPRFLKFFICLLLLGLFVVSVFAVSVLDVFRKQENSLNGIEKAKIIHSNEKPIIHEKEEDDDESTEPDKNKLRAEEVHNKDQLAVIDALKHSWRGYEQYAWGHDHLRPNSKSYDDWFHLGLTIVDSLDTLLLMGLNDEFRKAVKWIETDLSFDIGRDVNCFETTIRVLGGLLSAYHLSEQPILLGKAEDLGYRLLHCFDSPSKTVPYSDVNLRSQQPRAPVWNPDSSLSEVSSLQIEFRDLSRATGNDLFEKTSFKASEHIHQHVTRTGEYLLPMYINPHTGSFTRSTITLGARADSYYEYLLKQYLQTRIPWLLDDYMKSVEAIQTQLIKTTTGNLKLTYVAEKLLSKDIKPKMDHLVCFLPGTLALGYYVLVGSDTQPNSLAPEVKTALKSHLETAEALARTCYHMYNLTSTGLAPEIAYFGEHGSELNIHAADSHNLLRPEYVESLFYLYHITKKEMYREQGRQILESFNRYCKVPSGGYTSISDVRSPNAVRPKDKMESFWTAETLKYLYLLFVDDDVFIKSLLTDYVFNTEAHLVPAKVYSQYFKNKLN